MKFGIHEELSLIDFLYEITEWWAIEGKHLIKIILQDKVPFLKITHCRLQIFNLHITFFKQTSTKQNVPVLPIPALKINK